MKLINLTSTSNDQVIFAGIGTRREHGILVAYQENDHAFGDIYFNNKFYCRYSCQYFGYKNKAKLNWKTIDAFVQKHLDAGELIPMKIKKGK